MSKDTHRYFIELQMDKGLNIPRNREAELRRAQASEFISQLSDWLQKEELKDKVASVAITALGQVQITCEQDLISRLQTNESMPISTIRPGLPLTESLQRVGGW